MYSKAYRYTLDENLDLLDYRMEQQAQIIEDYCKIAFQNFIPRFGYCQNTDPDAQLRKLYENVLANFLKDPGYAKRR